MLRRPCTSSLIRATGTSRSLASWFWLRLRGSMNSQRRISPGGIGSRACPSSIAAPLEASMVVQDFYVEAVAVGPPETKPPLVVDPDAVLAGTISFQQLEPVSRDRRNCREIRRRVEHLELPSCHPLDRLKAPDEPVLEQRLGVSAPERPDHPSSLFCRAHSVKRNGARVELFAKISPSWNHPSPPGRASTSSSARPPPR